MSGERKYVKVDVIACEDEIVYCNMQRNGQRFPVQFSRKRLESCGLEVGNSFEWLANDGNAVNLKNIRNIQKGEKR